MSGYYRDDDRPHEGHHSGPPRRDGDDYRNDRERGEKKDDDHEILGTLAGAVAGGLGGGALGKKSGHGVLGGLAGAVAGAFVGHEAEEKIDDWKDKRDEKKHEEERREQYHGGGGGGGYGGERRRSGSRSRSRSRSRSHSRPRHHEAHGDGEEVTVHQGDTLRGIAARFDHVSFEEIARLNNISNPDLIYPGQVLRIPRR